MNKNSKQSRPARPPQGEPFDSLGQTWWLSEVTPELRRQYAQPIRARARQALLDDRQFLTDEQYAEEREVFQSRIDAGAYEWGPPVEKGGTGPGRAVAAVLDTTEGKILLLQLLLAEAHGHLPVEQVVDIFNANPEGVAAALRAAMGLPSSPPADEAKPGETTQTQATEPVPATAGEPPAIA